MSKTTLDIIESLIGLINEFNNNSSSSANIDSNTKTSEKKEITNDNNNKKKKVMISGCYDLLHSGHIAFFNEAAKYGELHVRIGSDANIMLLKKHAPMFPEHERLYMVRNIKAVYDAQISSGTGFLDFEPDLDIIKPDIFVVNEDGDRPNKRAVVEKRGIEYRVCSRIPAENLTARSSTDIKAQLTINSGMKSDSLNNTITNSNSNTTHIDHKNIHSNHDTHKDDLKVNHLEIINPNSCNKIQNNNNTKCNEDEDMLFPWRICLIGGWLDQPWVSKLHPGCVVTVNVKPKKEFKERSGLGTSTRKVGMKLWGKQGPPKELSPIEAAKLLFGAENPPGSKYISGSQDHLGLLLPGINCLHYQGEFWPHHIETLMDEKIMHWLQSVLWFIPWDSRPDGYDPLKTQHLTRENAKLIADASALGWEAINTCDSKKLGKSLSLTMKGWKALLPETVPDEMTDAWTKYERESHGVLFTGAGGGFLIVVSDSPVPGAFQLEISTRYWWE